MVLPFLSPKNASGKRHKSLFIVKYCYGRTIFNISYYICRRKWF